MSDYLLWKQLTPTDFSSMHGTASPFGRGGGARHIALGVATKQFPIDEFLNPRGHDRVRVLADSGGFGSGPLIFASISKRRNGEWMIADQHAHRHPAWTVAAGFPAEYIPADPPTIFVFRVGEQYHARVGTLSQLSALASELPNGVKQKGITPTTYALLSAFKLSPSDLINSFEEYQTVAPSVAFDPTTIEEGRRRQFASIIQRQGQGPFRNALLNAYCGRCAITRTRTPWVLEAAHIVPYRGIKTNVLPNGLLLRSDVHTLFDLGLISIEPTDRQVRVSSVLQQSPYKALHRRPLLQPTKLSARPSAEALAYHYGKFRE